MSSQQQFPVAASLLHRNGSLLLPQGGTEIILSGLFPHRSGSPSLPQGSTQIVTTSEAKKGMDLSPTYTRSLEDSVAATWEFTCLHRKPKHSGNSWQEFQRGTGHGPASNARQTLWLSTIVELGAAMQDFSSLQSRTKQLVDSWGATGCGLASYFYQQAMM